MSQCCINLLFGDPAWISAAPDGWTARCEAHHPWSLSALPWQLNHNTDVSCTLQGNCDPQQLCLSKSTWNCPVTRQSWTKGQPSIAALVQENLVWSYEVPESNSGTQSLSCLNVAKCGYAVVKVTCIKCLHLKKGKLFSKSLTVQKD